MLSEEKKIEKVAYSKRIKTIHTKRKNNAILLFVTLQTQHQEVLCRGTWQLNTAQYFVLCAHKSPAFIVGKLHSICTEITRDSIDFIWNFIRAQLHFMERLKLCKSRACWPPDDKSMALMQQTLFTKMKERDHFNSRNAKLKKKKKKKTEALSLSYPSSKSLFS